MALSAIQTPVSVQPQSVGSNGAQQTAPLFCLNGNPSTAISKGKLQGKWLQCEIPA